MKYIEMEESEFKINGAGILKIGKSSEILCGGEEGFSIGVSWTDPPFIGGVIPKTEAKKLANHILDNL